MGSAEAAIAECKSAVRGSAVNPSGYIPSEGLVSKFPNLQAIIDGRVSGSFREWPMIRRELQTLDGDINEIFMESAAFHSLLTDICNEFMDVDADGRFFGSELAERANKLLGI